MVRCLECGGLLINLIISETLGRFPSNFTCFTCLHVLHVEFQNATSSTVVAFLQTNFFQAPDGGPDGTFGFLNFCV